MKLISYYFFITMATIINIINPFIIGKFLDMLNLDIINMYEIYHYCKVFAILNIVSILIGYIVRRLGIEVQTLSAFELNKNLINQIQKTQLNYVKKYEASYLAQRLNRDSNSLIIFSVDIMNGVISNALKVILSLHILHRFSDLYIFIILTSVVIYFFIYRVMKSVLFHYKMLLINTQTDFFSNQYEQIEYTENIKLLSIFREVQNTLKQAFYKLYAIAIKHNNYDFNKERFRIRVNLYLY